jgi:hypothetical protein
MIDLLLDPKTILILLAFAAVATPVAAYVVARTATGRRRRLALVAGAAGPFALAFWGLHNAILATVGFDSVLSVLLAIGLCGAVGFFAGRWVAAGE